VAIKDRSIYLPNRGFSQVNSIFGSFGRVDKMIRTRNGISNPNWKKQVDAHVNATTSMSGVFMTQDSTPGWSKNEKTTGLTMYNGEVAAYNGAPPGSPVIPTLQAHQRAVQRFLKQVRAAQTQMSGQVFLGELKEAMHMLRHPAEALRKALKESYLDKLKRIKDRDPKRWKKAISQTWLEGTFGWRPFVNDLQDAAKAYNELCYKGDQRFLHLRAVGKADPKNVDQVDQNVSFPAGSSQLVRKTQSTWDEAVCVIRGEAKAQANTTTMDKLKIFGLQPSEFIPTAWELLPWSFLVDYFTNIGDILENSVTDTSNLAWAAESTVSIRKRRVMMSPQLKDTQSLQGPTFVSMTYSDPSTAFWQNRSVSRSVGTDLSIPPLRFELPGNPIQQLNIVALWAQAYYGLNPQKSFRR
jgi:hypothetical protein